jgi:hypothetical protein
MIKSGNSKKKTKRKRERERERRLFMGKVLLGISGPTVI